MRNIIDISDVNNLILEQTKSDRALENNEIELTRDELEALGWDILDCTYSNGRVVKNKDKANAIDRKWKNKELDKFCGRKTSQAKLDLLSKNATQDLLERYERKVKIANSKDKSSLQLEADLKGITVDKLATLIKTKNTKYNNALNVFIGKLEAIRTTIAKEIENNNFDRAKELLENVKDLNKDTTDDEIKAWLN